ncbi:MAG TPA: PAS domain-containing sensor histidine kinase [Methylothermaceae bacterium]|nr:PAS domain-containing sensor histidine kinase [Methylothermaceae bacterium]
MNDERFHQRILEHLGNGVLLFDRNQRLRYLNPAGEMLLATSAHKALNQQAKDLFSSLGEKIATDLEHTIASCAPRVERHLPLKQGNRTMLVHCAMTPLLEGDAVEAVIMEIEPVENYYQLSRDAQLQAQQEAINQLLRGLAHEIKNPLGGLRGAAQLLASELPDTELKEYTNVIIHEADRLRTLIDRMVAPDQPLRLSQINIHQVLEHVRQLLLAEYPKLAIRCDYDPSLPPIHGDPDQLIQAFLNIARNAAQALEGEGSITLRSRIQRRVTIRQQLHRLVVRVDIIDQGPGIPPQLLEQIFYPMVTGRAEGTGLGLSIAQALISRHGGLIECRSKPGHTCFSAYLPLENPNGQRSLDH